MPDSAQERIDAALALLVRFGQHTDESHHQSWLLDQVVRALTGEGYEAWLREFRDDDDPDGGYEWWEGIAP